MKKFLKKQLGIILMLIIGYQQYCYADLILDNPMDTFKPIAFFIVFIGVVIFIINTFSFLLLKLSLKKKNNSEVNIINEEKIKKKKNSLQIIIYLCSIIYSILGIVYLYYEGYIASKIIICIPVILFIISFIVRLIKNKKISNVICLIAVIFVCGLALWSQEIKKYNNQFEQYQGVRAYGDNDRYVKDVEGLVNTAIKNNESGKKITLVYQNTKYNSTEDLKQLLSELNENKKYYMTISYDNNYYAEYITLNSYTNVYLYNLDSYIGNNQSSDLVKSLIEFVQSFKASNEEIKIQYIDKNKKITIDISNSKEISNLINQIEDEEKYNVNIKSDSDVVNIEIEKNTNTTNIDKTE